MHTENNIVEQEGTTNKLNPCGFMDSLKGEQIVKTIPISRGRPFDFDVEITRKESGDK